MAADRLTRKYYFWQKSQLDSLRVLDAGLGIHVYAPYKISIYDGNPKC